MASPEEAPEAPPLRLCYHIGPAEEPGYLCIAYSVRFEEHEIDCQPVSMPLPLARRMRALLEAFQEKMADSETYVYTEEIIWRLPDKTMGRLAFHHSKVGGEEITIGRVGCYCPDLEEFLTVVEEAIAEIATGRPWPVKPIEWFQRFRQN